MIAHIDSLFELFSTFPDEQACLDRLRSIRWRDGEFCPQCGDHRVYHFSDRKSFKCGACRRRFSMKVGTIFEDTKLPLRKWFIAIWMLTNHPKGIASTTLAKDLKITQKSAWFVLHRLRYAAQTKSFNAPLKGIVESDAMFVGGKNKNRHAEGGKPAFGGVGMVVVLGYVAREGELRAEHDKNNNAKTGRDGVRRNVQPGSKLMTDDDAAFDFTKYDHRSVAHSEGEYVRGEAHTNTIESVRRSRSARASAFIIGFAQSICNDTSTKWRGASTVAIWMSGRA